MEINRKELKRLAREAMGLPTPRFWMVTLVYLLLTTGVSLALTPFQTAPDGSFHAVGLFLTILLSLYSTVVAFGFKLWALWTSRRLEPGLGALIQGFEVAGRIIWMQVMIGLHLFVWCFGLAFLLMIVVVMVPPTGVFLIPVLTALIWVVTLRYALADFLLADHPDDGPAAAIQRSVALMRGWKWELFKLDLSFLGWDLINWVLSSLVLTFLLVQSGFFQAAAAVDFTALFQGLGTGADLEQYQAVVQLYRTVSNGMLASFLTTLITLPLSLWLIPYRTVAQAGFYDARLKLQKESAPQMPPL